MKNIKRKILFLEILFISLMTFSIGIINVNADYEHGTEGTLSGYAVSCSSGNCYSLGTGGVRFSIIGPDGKKKGKVVDFWYLQSGVDYYYVTDKKGYTIYSITLKDKYLKQELNSVPVSNSSFTRKEFSTSEIQDNSIEKVAPGVLDGMTSLFCWGSTGLNADEIHPDGYVNEAHCVNNKTGTKYESYNQGYYINSEKKMNTRVPNVTETVIKRIVANSKGTYNADKGNYAQNIIAKLTEGTSDTFDSQTDFIQVEPLTQWANVNLNSGCKSSTSYGTLSYNLVFLGTPSEFSFMINALDTKLYKQDSVNSYFNAGMGFSGYGNADGEYRACPFDTSISSPYYRIVTFGITTTKQDTIPNKIFNACSSWDKCFEKLEIGTRKNTDLNGWTAASKILNSKDAYGVSFIKGSELGGCVSEIKKVYTNKKISKISSSVSSNKQTKEYDAEVSKICKKYLNTEDCDWLKWTNNGGNFRNYGIDINNLASCSKPTCNQVAKSKIENSDGTKNHFELFIEKWKKKYKDYPNNKGELILKMVGDIFSSDPHSNITNDSHYWWGEISLQNAFKFLTIKYYNSSNLKLGTVKDGTMNNIILTEVFGESIVNNNDYCGVSTCPTMLSKLNGKLSNKYNGKTALEWMSILYPKYEMLSPELLKNEDTGEIDYSLAACQEAPYCDTQTIKASCVAGNSIFTFTDSITDSTYNEGKSFTMNVSTFAKLTSGTFQTNPSCLNAGFAYTSINGVKLEKKNVQKSKNKGEYNGESNCWESVTFDLPKSVGTTNPIEAGTVFRWGTGFETDTSSNIYGTMTIHRFCTINPQPSKTSVQIGSEWANVINGKPLIGATVSTGETSTGVVSSNAKINPEIILHYQEAVPEKVQSSYTEKSYKMDVELTRVSTNLYARTSANGANLSSVIDPDVIDYTGPICGNPNNTLKQCQEELGSLNDHPRRASLDKKDFPDFFNNGGVVETTASYNIVYNDNLKWYSDKSDNYKKITSTDIKKSGGDESDAKYAILGYGLPTSFVTPELPSGNFFYGYSISNADKRGKMYVTIKNVGTKVSSSNYHFNNLLKSSISDVLKDDDNGVYSDALVYSCGFNIRNKLYCYECNPDIYKKDCPSGICKPKNEVPKGIDVVFRTVELVSDSKELEKAFPGRSGTGRNVGDNWNFSKYNDEAKKENSKDDFSGKFIAQLLNKNIYESEPKYIIDLTPTNIQRIRKENDKDSYTSMKNYEFEKNSKTKFDVIDWNKANAECKDTNKNGCRRMSYILRTVSEANSTNDKQLDYAYTYSASPFISDLISKGDLKGTCATESDTKKRAQKYAESYGC